MDCMSVELALLVQSELCHTPCLSGLAIEGHLSLTLSPAFPTNPPPSFILNPYKNSLLICCGSPGYCVVTPGTPPPLVPASSLLALQGVPALPFCCLGIARRRSYGQK